MSKRRMRVIVFGATKGGVGKTTLASAIAVRAAADGGKVALIDTDPQLSLARWHELRGLPDNPNVVGLDADREAVGLVLSQKWDWVIIDTPPALLDKIEQAIVQADLVVIPCRTSALDVEAVRDVLAICKDHGKRFVFVINQVLSKADRLTLGARKYLEQDGKVLATEVRSLKAFQSAMTLGKSGPELRDGKLAAEDISALWAEIKAAAGA